MLTRPHSSHTHRSLKAVPHSYVNTLYIVPIGEFVDGLSPSTEVHSLSNCPCTSVSLAHLSLLSAPLPQELKTFAKAFFGVNVAVTKPVPLKRVSQHLRTGGGAEEPPPSIAHALHATHHCLLNPNTGGDGQPQILVKDIFSHLKTMKKPRDCFCTVGVTMTDM